MILSVSENRAAAQNGNFRSATFFLHGTVPNEGSVHVWIALVEAANPLFMWTWSVNMFRFSTRDQQMRIALQSEPLNWDNPGPFEGVVVPFNLPRS